MIRIVGVKFKENGKVYHFDPADLPLSVGMHVIVETARGLEYGEVTMPITDIPDEELVSPLKKVVRIATPQDTRQVEINRRKEKEAFDICLEKIEKHKLEMKLIHVEYSFDANKILFYFTANGRVDFRELVKDLAGVFRTRIELRQIGVRDEAKMLGGLGPCGRPICCGAFLGDFQPVSIKMAKEQNLSLNPTKISGVCGRLMCCLKYEQDTYEQTRKRMPKVGKEVITPDGVGVVWDLNVIKETIRVRISKGDTSELKDFGIDEIQRPAQPHAKEKTVEADKQEKTDKPEKTEKEEKAHKSEKKNRGEEKQAQRPAKAEKNAKPSREKPVKEENEDKEEAVQEQPKAAVSPWQQAVAAALKAAKQNAVNVTETQETDEDDPEVLSEQDLLDGAE